MAHLAPPADLNSLLHPISFVYQWWQVYLLHVVRESDINNEERRKTQEDVEKRRAYRKAHGTERAQQGPLPWFGRAEDKEEEEGEEGELTKREYDEQREIDEESGAYIDFQGNRRRPPVKRWFGIWT